MPRQATRQMRQPRRSTLCRNVICLETKNANVLTRDVACSQLIWLVWWQPMAQVTQRMRWTEAVHACQNWLYTLAHCSMLRLLHSMRNLPQRKCILSFTNSSFPITVCWVFPVSHLRCVVHLFHSFSNSRNQLLFVPVWPVLFNSGPQCLSIYLNF